MVVNENEGYVSNILRNNKMDKREQKGAGE